jgi:hypothetical protein
MSPTLEKAFAQRTLVRPGADGRPDIVHLVRALSALCGVEHLATPGPVQNLMELIGPAEHYVFILLDGLGMNILRRLPADGFFARHLHSELNSTCPSTTACALTAVATAHWPTRHGVTGWFTHLPDLGFTATVLPFAERMTHQPLALRGLTAQDVLPLPPVLPLMTRRAISLSPSYIANTVYNHYARGGTTGLPYKKIADASEQIVAYISAAAEPTFTYLYLDEIDTLCHHVGVAHEAVDARVVGIAAELDKLADALAGRARIVLTADHGLIDVPATDQTLLRAGDPLLELLLVPPSGDARMPIFHLRPGSADTFVEAFNERFGDRMFLLATEQADQMRLFGPEAMSTLARRRFGDFVAIPFKPATLAYLPPEKQPGNVFYAVHAGLSPDEMEVPLCLT